MFTKTEETILNALTKRYKYIFRSPGGELRICESVDDVDCYLPICEFNHLFKDVKPGCEPIRFRGPILDDTEREYLKAVFKPFHHDIECVKKIRYRDDQFEFIEATMNDHEIGMVFPDFEIAKMYTGMNPDKAYTLEELGITYD